MRRRAAALAAVLLAAACGGGRTDAAAAPAFDPKSPGPVEMPGEPMPEPFPWRPVTAAAAAALVGAALVARRLRHASAATDAAQTPPPAVPAEGPHVRALKRIERLRAQAPRMTEDHVETAAIVRDYVRERFGIAAGERTTDELLAAPQIGASAKRRLAGVLHPCDLVKFARDEPAVAARAALLDAAETFVREAASP
jgi:hypothetical protein